MNKILRLPTLLLPAVITLLISNDIFFIHAEKFSMAGPVLTVTMKDPFQNSPSSTSSSNNNDPSPHSPLGDIKANISNLNPILSWVIQSNGPPMPQLLPFLKSLSAKIGYQYENLKCLPSNINANIKFGTFLNNKVDVQINPNYQVKNQKTDVTLRVNVGASNYGLVKLTNKGKKVLDFVRTSHKISLPFNAASSVTITPSFDFVNSAPSCLVSGETGSGRTAAVVDLNLENPTLSVMHALDNRNVIAPEISLSTAKIMYNWDMTLDSGTIRTRVDPTSAIHVQWSDRTANGKWVTDFKLPLVGTHGPLAADIKVRRQFMF